VEAGQGVQGATAGDPATGRQVRSPSAKSRQERPPCGRKPSLAAKPGTLRL
jgi:hypothetical protein